MRVPWASRFLNVSNVAWDRKKKASDQISGAKNNSRKETWLYIEDDMRVPISSSGITVWEAARDRKKKASDQISGAKNNPRKEILLYVEDDMRVPFCSSGLNVSKAAQNQKKNEVARNQGVKKIQEERFQLGCIWTSGLSNYPAWPFDSYNFSPLQNRKVPNFLKKQESPMLRKDKKTRRFNI